jgi:hypothetical protein
MNRVWMIVVGLAVAALCAGPGCSGPDAEKEKKSSLVTESK